MPGRTSTALLLVATMSAAIAATDRASAASSTVEGSTPTVGGVVSARFDIAKKTLFVRGCTASPCDPANGEPSAISIADEIDPNGVTITAAPLTGGVRVLHVVARSLTRKEIAWEAIVGWSAGKARVVWSGGTGFGADGEGEGHRLVVEASGITVGDLRRELTICGQEETLLAPRKVDAPSMSLHAIAATRIPKAVRDAAPTINGVLTDVTPIGSVLGVRGASTHDGASITLVDGDPATAWTETRKGDGRGEFVVFSAPKELPIQKLSLVVRPTVDVAGFEQPRSMWVVVDDATYAVKIPEAKSAGARVDLVFPSPKATTCVAIALDRGEGDGKGDPSVGLAEVDGVPSFPSTVHTLDDLVTLLDSTSDDFLARVVLGNAGNRGAAAIETHIEALGDRGKSEAVEVLESTPCAAAAPALTRLSWDAPKETASEAREVLDACGAAAKDAIVAAFEAGPDRARDVLAARLARVDPVVACKTLLQYIPKATPARRRTYRTALARVVSTPAGRDAVVAWLATAPKPTEADANPVIELVRAVGPSDDVEPIRSAVLDALFARLSIHDSRAFERSWLAAEALASFASRGDPRAINALRALFNDADRYLRARAASVAGNVAALRPELVTAARDADPRVRQSAFQALRVASVEQGVAPSIVALSSEGWTYVRVAAVELLGESKPAPDVDAALAEATYDVASDVRLASIRALVARGAKSGGKAILARARDLAELVDVRLAAIDALGSLCDDAAIDALTDFARKVNDGDRAHVLGLAAIVALGKIHPKDLASRFEGIDTSILVVKDALARALHDGAHCQP